jgi:hypothetical protein
MKEGVILVKTSKNPGPGAYPLKNLYETVPGSAIGRSPRKAVESVNKSMDPGPGLYVTEGNIAKYDSPKYGFGSSKRKFLE